MNPDAILEFYRDYDEAERLARHPQGRLELTRTRELLSRLLPPAPASVLDVGGATGVYAGWLAERGYRVHLVDLVPSHVERAAALPGVTASLGDARALDAADANVDAVLLLGPLYHLTERADRVRALSEARRVTRPGGLVAAAVISRYSGMLEQIWLGNLTTERLEWILPTIATGRHDPRIGFMATHFHTGPEAAGEFTDAGLAEPAVYGIEGPGWPVASAAGGTDREPVVFESALRAARAVERDPLMHPASGHLLVTAHVPG